MLPMRDSLNPRSGSEGRLHEESMTGKQYASHVYPLIYEAFLKKGKPTARMVIRVNRHWKKHNVIPQEVRIAFDKLEHEGCDINKVPAGELTEFLEWLFSRRDRRSDYDNELKRKIGIPELLRWRTGGKLQDGTSAARITETLRDHAVPARHPTKIEQNPRVRFAPKGAYHRRENL